VFALVAEAAAHIRRDDAQVAFRKAQFLGEEAPHVVRRLRRVIDRQTAGRRIRYGEDGTRLDGRPDKAVVDQIERGDVGGRRERAFNRRRIATLPAEAHVGGSIPMKLRRAGRKRGAGISDRR